MELPKKDTGPEGSDYTRYLSELTSECPEIKEAIKLAHYRKRQLAEVVDRYNYCKYKPFPIFSYGILLGYEASKLIPHGNLDDDLTGMDYRYDGGFTVGLFVDKPISFSEFSVHSELYFSRHGFSNNKHVENKDIDLVVNTSTLSLPILLRYTYPYYKIRPYVNTGSYFTYSLKNQDAVYEATIEEGIIEINKISENSLISQFHIGFSAGGGVVYKITYRNSIFLEARFSKRYELSGNDAFNNSEISFFTGINF